MQVDLSHSGIPIACGSELASVVDNTKFWSSTIERIRIAFGGTPKYRPAIVVIPLPIVIGAGSTEVRATCLIRCGIVVNAALVSGGAPEIPDLSPDGVRITVEISPVYVPTRTEVLALTGVSRVGQFSGCGATKGSADLIVSVLYETAYPNIANVRVGMACARYRCHGRSYPTGNKYNGDKAKIRRATFLPRPLTS